MKKKVLRTMFFIFTLIFVLKMIPVFAIGENIKSIDTVRLNIEKVSHVVYEDDSDWIHLQAIKRKYISIKSNYRFGVISQKMMDYLPRVICEAVDLRGTLRDRIDRNKEMLANYHINTEKEVVALTSRDNKETIEVQEEIVAIVEDISSNDIITKNKIKFLVPDTPSILKNLVEGNCIGVRSPPTFKETIYLI